MPRRRIFPTLLAAAALCVAASCTLAQTAFTYQGRLESSGSAVDGDADLRFRLMAASTGGAQIGPTLESSAVPVANGLFTSELDFGFTSFDGNQRWLEIAVRFPAGSGSFVTLTPRQQVTAAPYAASAAGWSDAHSMVPDQRQESSNALTITSSPVSQTFTVGVTGLLTAASVAASNYSGTSQGFTVSVRRAGTVIASRLLTIPANGGVPRITFTPPPPVIAGEQLTLALDSSSILPFRYSFHTGNPYPAGDYTAPGAPAGSDLVFATYVGDTDSVSTTRHVGIDAPYPSYPLQLGEYLGGTLVSQVESFKKQVVIAGDWNVGTNAGDSVKLLIADYDNEPGSEVYPIFVEDENNVIDFYLRTSSGARTAYFGGSLGLGTQQPAGPLHVFHSAAVGDVWPIRFEQPNGVHGGLRISDPGYLEMTNHAHANAGTGFARLDTTGAWTTVSDERLKTNLTPAANLLETVLALRPVTYRMPEVSPKLQLGFSAQQVRDVLPSVVTDGDVLTMDYARISVAAVGAIQELKARYDADLAELRAQNERLLARLEALEAAQHETP